VSISFFRKKLSLWSYYCTEEHTVSHEVKIETQWSLIPLSAILQSLGGPQGEKSELPSWFLWLDCSLAAPTVLFWFATLNWSPSSVSKQLFQQIWTLAKSIHVLITAQFYNVTRGSRRCLFKWSVSWLLQEHSEIGLYSGLVGLGLVDMHTIPVILGLHSSQHDTGFCDQVSPRTVILSELVCLWYCHCSGLVNAAISKRGSLTADLIFYLSQHSDTLPWCPWAIDAGCHTFTLYLSFLWCPQYRVVRPEYTHTHTHTHTHRYIHHTHTHTHTDTYTTHTHTHTDTYTPHTHSHTDTYTPRD